MAKYNVTYSCGHAGEVQLYGPGKDRERKLAWYRTQADCPACYKAKQDAERVAAAATASQTAGGAFGELPAITEGSDKQIHWATRIRDAKLAEIAAFMADRLAKAPADKLAAIEADRDGIVRVMSVLIAAQTSAAWWIDRRDLATRDLVMLAAREAGK